MSSFSKNSPTNDMDYITFESLQSSIGITEKHLLTLYLKEIFKDLSSRTRTDPSSKQGISKITFYEYIKLPIFVSEKLFSSLDIDNDTFLNKTEFVEGLTTLYTGTFTQTLKIVFDMLDFDKSGEITKEDAKILLSYLPLKNENSKFQYKFQMESLNEIEEIINETFKERKTLNFNDFKSSVQIHKSDIYLQILCFLYLQKPFNKEAVESLQLAKKKQSSNFLSFSSTIKMQRKSNQEINRFGQIEDDDSNQVLLKSPYHKSALSPVVSLLSSTPPPPKYINHSNSKQSGIFDEESTPVISGKKGMIRLHNEKFTEYQVENFEEALKHSKNIFQSPTMFLLNNKNKTNEIKYETSIKNGVEIEEMKIGDKVVAFEKLELEVGNESNNEDDEDNKSNNSSDSQNNKVNYNNTNNSISYQNWVYKLSNQDNLKKYYLVTINKDLFYYKTETKEELLGMHNLSGCFVKDNGEKIIHKIKFYCFQIIYQSKIKNYYVTEKEIAMKFIETLKTSIGYLNFFDFYEMKGDLGEGRFGKVKLGKHKGTNEKIAIKIIKKSKMSIADSELVKSEIDIMKLCHHPNVIRLLDHFENADHIFIVMEYLSGGDLDTYLRKQKTLFTEEKAANLMFQMVLGIQYLHKYGIVHRDLKPENIMLTEPNDNGKIKIMDFGLSKIMGPQEKASDGFGTLNFVAPEVLLRTPYNKAIDIWSIGIILYYILSGNLPFDDPDDNEEEIAKYTVFNEVEFPKKIWAKRSNEVIDLIKKCLIKEPEKRIKIDEVINHEWFSMFPHIKKTHIQENEECVQKEGFRNKKKLAIDV